MPKPAATRASWVWYSAAWWRSSGSWPCGAQGADEPVVADRARRLADPGLVGEVGAADDPAGRQGVACRDQDVAVVVADGGVLDALGRGQRRDVPVVGDGQIDDALGHEVDGDVRVHLRQLRVQGGVFTGQGGECGGEQAPGRRRERAHREASGGQTAPLFERGLRAFHDGQQLPCGSCEMERVLGERDAPAPAFQEGRTGLPFQLGDLLGDRGRGVAERGGSGGDRAVDVDRVQRAQPGQIEQRKPPRTSGLSSASSHHQ